MSKRKPIKLNPEYDWSKEAFFEALCSPEFASLAGCVQRKKQAKRNAKIRKKQEKKKKRQTAVLTTALIANRNIKNLMK